MSLFLAALISGFNIFIVQKNFPAAHEQYSIELQLVTFPSAPAIHSLAFAKSNEKWLFTGERIMGELIQTLNNENSTAGKYEVNLDAQNTFTGKDISTGIYYYRLRQTVSLRLENALT